MIRIIAICSCLVAAGGCIRSAKPASKVVRPKSLDKGAREHIPESWKPAYKSQAWSAIVIHHSGTPSGNAAIFGRYHEEKRGWDGIAYHFVIGNGTKSGDGEVEVTFRWRKQLTGAHCRALKNSANNNTIGICLVGNFNRTKPTRRQMQSLVKLVRFLQSRYDIPKGRIYGHKTVPGARPTACPGKNFPMSELKSMSFH